GRLFGPLLLVWFGVIAALGIRGIASEPGILRAVNALYRVQFMLHGGLGAVVALSSVFLCVTGGEALYADMGHFGRRPIRIGWDCAGLPCLLAHYYGQAGLRLPSPR